MEIKHILIPISVKDYEKYLKLKKGRTWQQVLLDGLNQQGKQE